MPLAGRQTAAENETLSPPDYTDPKQNERIRNVQEAPQESITSSLLFQAFASW